jgi:hypothetical protein
VFNTVKIQENALLPAQECRENRYCSLYNHAKDILFGRVDKSRLRTTLERTFRDPQPARNPPSFHKDKSEPTERKVSVAINVEASRVHDVLADLVWFMPTIQRNLNFLRISFAKINPTGLIAKKVFLSILFAPYRPLRCLRRLYFYLDLHGRVLSDSKWAHLSRQAT